MPARTVSATDFKAKCLALIDEVNTSGDPITITKRGQPVAVLTPMKKVRRKTTEGMLKGKGEIVGDIVDTSDLYKDWELYQEWMAAEARRERAAAKRHRKAS
jgi:prevent-host-death family protein